MFDLHLSKPLAGKKNRNNNENSCNDVQNTSTLYQHYKLRNDVSVLFEVVMRVLLQNSNMILAKK